MVDKFKWSAHKNEIRDYDSDVTVGDLDEYYASIVSSISGFQVIDSAAPPGQKYRTGPLMSETGGPRTMKFCNNFETMDRESGEEINPFGRDPLALSFAATDPSGTPIATTNEGDLFAFKLLAGNAFEGEEFDYTITGVSSIDFTPGSAPLTGTFVTTDSETAIIYLQSIANDTIESEIINITLDDFPEATLDLPLIDVISSVDDWEPVQAGPFNEGDTFNMIVNGTSLDATLYWEIDEPDAASNYDVTSGTFATDGSTGTTQAITILEDEKTENGNLPDNIILKDSALGTELGSYPFVYNDTSTATYSVFTASEVGFVPNASNKALWPRGLPGAVDVEGDFSNRVKAAQGYIDSSYDEVADSANDPVNFTRFYVFYSGAVDSNEDFNLTSSRQHRLLFGTPDIEAIVNPSGGGNLIVPTDTYFNPGSVESIDPKRWYKNTFESPFGLSWCDVRFVKDNFTEGNIPFSAWYRQSRQNNQGVYIYNTKAAYRGMVANDTSKTPSYSVSGTRNINESTTGQDGNNVGAGIWRYTVNTENVDDGTPVYWNLSLDSSVPPTTDTHLPLQFEELSGSTTITGNTATFDIVTTDSAGELTTEIEKDYMLRIHTTSDFTEPALTGNEVVTGGKVFQPITVIDTLKNPIHASATVGMQGVRTIVYNRNGAPDGSFGGRLVVLRIGNGWWQLGEQISPFYPNDFGYLYTLNDDFWAGEAYNGTVPTSGGVPVDLDYLTYLDGVPGNQQAIDLANANPLSAHSTATAGNVIALPPIDVANSTSTLRLHEKQPFLFPSASWSKENSKYFIVGLRNASRLRSNVPPNLQVFANYYSDGYGEYFQNTLMFPNQETTHGYHKQSSATKGQPSGASNSNSRVYADRFSYGSTKSFPNNSNPDKKYANTNGNTAFGDRINAYLALDFDDDNSYHEFKFRHLIYDAGPGSPNSVTGGSYYRAQYSVHHFWLNVRSWDPKFGERPNDYGNPDLSEIGEELFSTRINILIDHAFNNFPKPT